MSDPSSGVPQFDTAEYKSASGQETCAGCKQALGGNYYRVNGKLACERCTQQVQTRLPQDSHSAFVRGILFGLGGAIAGLIVYSAFAILTGIMIGYVALAVGWLVGTAMKKGSAGVGGRRYQIAAVALTYAAVSLSAIPVAISFYVKGKKPAAHASANPAGSSTSTTSPDATSANPSVADSQQSASPKPRPAAAALVATLLFAGLASPFLELSSGFSGIIGLVILFVGIRIAWKITSAPPLEILGPFPATAPLPPVPSGS